MLGAGPKLDYCLRDLFPAGRGPRPPLRYGACSTDHSRRRVTLGISVRWADAYPAHYPENWIDVTGRRGCFTVVQRADPAQVVRESDETDNVGVRVVRLPYRPGRQRCPRHAGFVPPAPPAPAAPGARTAGGQPGLSAQRRRKRPRRWGGGGGAAALGSAGPYTRSRMSA